MKVIPNSKFQIPNSRFGRRGFFIVEAMAALSILVVGFLGVVALLSSSLGLNRQITDAYTANYLAMEGVEVVKNVIDANNIQKEVWNCGFGSGNGSLPQPGESNSFEVNYYDSIPNGSLCVGTVFKPYNSNHYLGFDQSSESYYYGAPAITRFQRKVTISILTASSTMVSSLVNWTTRGGATKSVELDDVFWNWRP